MTYAEQKAAEIKIGQILYREYNRKSQSVQDGELKRIYSNLALALDNDRSGVNGAKEALYTLQHLEPWNGTPRHAKKLASLRKKLHHFLNHRTELCEKHGISPYIGA